MKRWIVFALVFVLGLNLGAIALADSDEITDFDPGLTNSMDMTANEWMETVETRAEITFTLAFDMTIAGGPTPDLSENAFIGKDGLDLVVYYHGDNDDIVVVYRPFANEASYFTVDTISDKSIEGLMEEVCGDGFYKNDMETLFGIMQEVQKGLEEDD